jgi:hypothetical protein
MTEPEKTHESLSDRLAPKPSAEDRTLEELARRKIAAEDDQLKRNLEELERLAGPDDPSAA